MMNTLKLFGLVSLLFFVSLGSVPWVYGNTLTIVTYNTKSHDKVDGGSWKMRIDNFVTVIVVPYRPGIIAIQEVYQWCKRCVKPACKNCENMDKGTYLKYILNRINEAIDTRNGRYYIATNVKSGHAIIGGWTCFSVAEEWEGEAIIYDSKQVNFIPAWPIHGSNHPGCSQWHTNLHAYYEFRPEKLWENDCLTQKDEHKALVSRVIFEFPKGSRHFVNFYNTHLSKHPCEIPETIEFIKDRQDSFRTDLNTYLLYMGYNIGSNVKIYPPIFAGDMNTKGLDKCEHSGAIAEDILRHFHDAPHDAYDPPKSVLNKYGNFQAYIDSPEFIRIENGKEVGQWLRSKQRIDKVWVGKGGDIWDHDVTLVGRKIARTSSSEKKT